MELRKTRLGLAAGLAFTLTGGSVLAQDSTPAGPWITPDQNVSLEGFESYEQLTNKLFDIERRAKGVLGIRSVAVTGEGRDVWLVTIGDPRKTPVLVITQQHGNEPHGTEAAIDIIKSLIASGKKSRKILDELYVLIIPRVNPDGGELFTRGNTDFDAPPRNSRDCFDGDGNVIPTELDQGRGVFSTTFVAADGTRLPNYDINRYHWPDWSQSWQILCNPGFGGRHFDPDLNPVPEAVGVRMVYDLYRPIWVMDVHNQGSSVTNDDVEPPVNRPGQLVTGSMTWPTNEGVAAGAVNLSKQMVVVAKRRSNQLGNMELTNYIRKRADGSFIRGGPFAGIARNAFGLLGTERIDAGEPGPVGGSVLVEIRGQGQKSIGMLKNNAREIISSVLEATADGSLFAVDPAVADEILPIGTDQSISNPRSEEADEESN
ncbi:MAG: M14 family zinc carboxypeptidase [Gammaproteobacteria bacterium]|nr:M14 family zinc carboxypeptidase [Gammaproteobacteria bacterium]